MSYSVKEAFYTLQGEGVRSGTAAVFLRFAGCNLWTGREVDRETAVCKFCDTDFVGINGDGGGRFESADALAAHVEALWAPNSSIEGAQRRFGVGPRSGFSPDGEGSPKTPQNKWVVCTGGEPGLQLDNELCDALHARGFRIAIESNGTLPLPASIDWVCISPKADTELVVTSGQELKLVFFQSNAQPERFESLDFQHFLLQPMDGILQKKHTEDAVRYCMANPKWKLSLQTHKFLGIR